MAKTNTDLTGKDGVDGQPKSFADGLALQNNSLGLELSTREREVVR